MHGNPRSIARPSSTGTRTGTGTGSRSGVGNDPGSGVGSDPGTGSAHAGKRTATWRARPLRLCGVVLCVALLTALQACGGSGGGSGSAGSGTSTPGAGGAPAGAPASASADGLLEFAGCLRQNGIDAPDPKPGQTMSEYFKSISGSAGRDRLREAADACADKLPTELQELRDAAQDPDKMLRFARCMRANGVDVPDPSGGRIDFGSVDRDSPTFTAAAQKCLPELTKDGAGS